MSAIVQEVFLILALTLLNGFFSGAEVAMLSARKTRLRELADDGNRSAREALLLRAEPERFLATVQVGITVVSATAAAFGGAVLEEPIAAGLQRLGAPGARTVALVVVIALVSFLSVVLGELVPKSLALRHAERATLLVARPLSALSRLATPVVWFLTASSNVVLRPFHDRTTFTEARLSPEELQQLVEESAAAGGVDAEAGEIASRAIDLGRLKVFSVMVPRAEICWLSTTEGPAEVRAALAARPHARYPLRDRSEAPLGYVLAHEVYGQLLAGEVDLRKVVHEIPAIPEAATALVALRELQRARTEIGLVVDETGAPVGLISIEALAEELFGEILGEREATSRAVTRVDDRTFDVRGETPVHELNRELDLELPVEPNAATLGGLVLATHGRFPERDTTVVLPGDVQARVLETAARRVTMVRLVVPVRPPAA